MPSKFGGIEIEENDGGVSRYGGIPINDNDRIEDDQSLPAIPGSELERQREKDARERRASQPAPEKVSLLAHVDGAADAALTAMSGMTTGAFGQAGGFLEGLIKELRAGEFGTHEAADRIEELMLKRGDEFTRKPTTKEGERQLSALGNILEPLSALPPVAEVQLAANTAMRAKGFVSGENNIVAFAKKAAQESGPPTKTLIEEKIKQGDPDVAYLGKVYSDGEIKNNPSIKKAKKQGFDHTALRSIETANPRTKQIMRDMLSTLKRRRTDADYRVAHRVTDSIGASVYERYAALNKLRKAKGTAVDAAARKLEGKFDIDGPLLRFIEDIERAGVRIRKNDDGTMLAEFGDVDISNVSGTKQSVSAVLARLNKGEMSAFDAHKLKRLINDSVEFGRLPTADAKIAKQVEVALKSFSDDLNKSLRGMSDGYKKANDDFASIVAPLSDMDRVFKSMLNSSDPGALEAGIGTKAARTIMSNNTGRAAMLSVLKEADAALNKNSVRFKDDIIKQAVFADELERMFGSEATTSLGGASQRATEMAIKAALGENVMIDFAKTAVNKVKGLNEEEAIRAMEVMLTSEKP